MKNFIAENCNKITEYKHMHKTSAPALINKPDNKNQMRYFCVALQ